MGINTHKYLRCIGVLLIITVTPLVIIGCEKGPNSPKGFSLPIGNAKLGEDVFRSYYCLDCHSISGVHDDHVRDIDHPVVLGGNVTRTKTYADLVTSIINPSHKIAKSYNSSNVDENGKSKMRNYNDIMTITELIDLVTFIQPHYRLVEYQRTEYNIYP